MAKTSLDSGLPGNSGPLTGLSAGTKMEKTQSALGLTRLEWIILITLTVIISILAVVFTIKGREAHYKAFRERAALIGQALESFARDHGGQYPPDGIDNQSPPGLSPGYIQWREEWNIDYEVHENGHGGNYVGLEYLGLYEKGMKYNAAGLTRNPELRKKYGRGEPIPGKLNRIWIYHEEAPTF